MEKQLAVAARAWLDAFSRMGLDADALMRDAGLTRDEVYDPEGRIAPENETALWTLAQQRSGDPHLALHAAEQLEWGAYRVIDLLAASAPTIGESFLRLSRYFPIINTMLRLQILPSGSTVAFRMSAPDLPVPLPPPAVEYTFAAIFLRTRQGLAVDYPLVRLDLAYQRPPDVAEHRRIFGCPLHFDQPHSQMILSDEVWDLPSRQSDAVLSEVLENHARLLLEKLPATEGFVGRVRSAIHDQLGGGDPSLAAVARALSMGERTLQRRLADEGAGFADLLDEERSRAARSYLRDPEVSLAEVAFLLGFADQSAFTRAFRRWTGVPPGRWRTENVI